MGGTTLVTKGILSPIEGDVVFHDTVLPICVDYEVNDITVCLPEEITADASLPDEVTACGVLEFLETDIQVPVLEVSIELEE